MTVEQPGECSLVTATQRVDERSIPGFSVHRHAPEPSDFQFPVP